MSKNQGNLESIHSSPQRKQRKSVLGQAGGNILESQGSNLDISPLRTARAKTFVMGETPTPANQRAFQKRVVNPAQRQYTMAPKISNSAIDFSKGLSPPKKQLFKKGTTAADNVDLDSIFKDSPGGRNPQDAAKRLSFKQAQHAQMTDEFEKLDTYNQALTRLDRTGGLRGLEDEESVLEQRINEMKQTITSLPVELEDLNINQLKKMINDELLRAYEEKPLGKADLRLSQAIARSKQIYNLELHLKNVKNSEDVALTKDFQKMAFQSDEYFSELQYPMSVDNKKLASQGVGVSLYLYFIKLVGLMMLILCVVFFGPYQLILIEQQDTDNEFWQSQISLSAFFSLSNITFSEEFKKTGKPVEVLEGVESKIEEGRLRTTLKMGGTLDEFYADGGNYEFRESLSEQLGIPIENIDLIDVYTGSIVTVYDLVQNENFTLEELSDQQNEIIGNGNLNLGYPIIDVATEAGDGSTKEIIKDGIVELEGYWRVIITPTESNAQSGLSRMPTKCDNATQIYFDDYQQCQTCEPYFHPDESNLECIQETCEKRKEIRLPSGRCDKCPQYTHPDPTNLECVADPCSNGSEIVLEDGSCQLCPDYSYPDHTKDYRECTTEVCSPKAFTTLAGFCQDCPYYSLAVGDGEFKYECEEISCDKTTQYYDIAHHDSHNNYYCRTCQEFFHPTEDGSECVQDQCDYENSILQTDGRCRTCSDYQYPDAQGKNCVSDACNIKSQILLPTGKCQDCPKTFYPNSEGRKCEQQDCSDPRMIWLENGLCETCPDFNHPDENKLACIADICQTTEILIQNGTCQGCSDYFHPDLAQRECIQDPCNFTAQIVELNGTCTKCAPYSYPDTEGKTCIEVDCIRDRQVMDVDRQCQTCDDYFYPNEDGTQCKQDICVPNRYGQCIPCPIYTRADLVQRECVSDVCDPQIEYMMMNGTCKQCPPYFFPSDDGYECEDAQCNKQREYLNLETHTCVECEKYSYPNQETGFGCTFSQCGEGQRLNEQGECEVCLEYTHPDASNNNRTCISDPCDFSQQILQLNGTCLGCQPYFYPDAEKRICLDAECNKRRQIFKRESSIGHHRQLQGGKTSRTQSENTQSNQERESNICVTCPNYSYPDDKGNECIADTCQNETQILMTTGVCRTCDTYSRPDSENKKCIFDECDIEKEILLSDGTCKACDSYFYPDEAGTKCLDGYCNQERQILTSENICETCPFFTHPNGIGTDCIKDDCDLQTQVQARNGSCATCQDYTYPDHDTNQCNFDQCDVLSQIILINGKCADCGPYTQPDLSFGRECVPLDCDQVTEYVDSNNICKECESFTHPNATGDGCTFDQCDYSKQILKENGRCFYCEYSYPDSEGKSCIKETCDYSSQILLPSGNCEICADYTYPKLVSTQDPDSKECVFDICSDRQVILPNGRCKDCEENFNPDETGKKCHYTQSQFQVTSEMTYLPLSDLPPISETSARTSLTMDGTLSEFTAAGGEEEFKNSLASELGIGLEKINVQTVQEGSIVVTYDLTAENQQELSELVTKQTETLSTSQVNLGFPILAVEVEAADGTKSRIIDDGVVVAEGFTEAIMTLTSTNKDLGLTVYPSNCQKEFQISLENGGCKSCGKYLRPNEDNSECIQDICDFQTQVLNDDGSCKTCPEYTYLDLVGMKCKTDECDAKLQIIKKDGTCKSCDDFSHADSQQRECIVEQCDYVKQILQSDGYCKLCEGRSHPDGEKRTCVDCDDYLTPNLDGTLCIDTGCDRSKQFLQIVSSGTQCADCEPFTYPTQDGIGCQQDSCNSTSIILLNGKCQECLYSYPDSDQKICLKDTCGANQIMNSVGNCVTCNSFSYPAPLNSTYNESRDCISDECQYFEILQENGRCKACDAYFHSDQNGTFCVEKLCDKENFILGPNKDCQLCPFAFYPDLNGLECKQDTCDPTIELLQVSGKCKKCEYSYPDALGRECISDNCDHDNGFITLMSGKCEKCPPYFNPDSTGRVCEDGQCDSTRQIHQGELCVSCDDYYYPNITVCLQEECDYSTQILQKSGKCKTCSSFTRVDESNRECIFDQCEFSKQIKIEGGYCETCDPYSYPDELGENCVKISCNETKEIMENKVCKGCDLFSYPNVNGDECISDVCENSLEKSQILLPTGRCEDCQPYYFTDSNGTSCIFEECDYSVEIVNASGKCFECNEFSYPKPVTAEYTISRECISDECLGIEKLLPSGKCEACGLWFKADSNGTSCVDAQCNKLLQILLQSGQCKTCEFGFYPNEDGTECIQDSCDPLTEILQISGKCGKCPDYQHPDETFRSCVSDQCDYIVEKNVINGTCVACPPYNYPSDSKRDCILSDCDQARNTFIRQVCTSCGDYKYPDQEGINCLTDTCDNSIQILNKLGTCDTCPEYRHPDDQNLVCMFDQCENQTQILLQDGTCKSCEDYRHPDESNLECIKDQCSNDTQILKIDGRCETCLQYSHPDSGNFVCIVDQCDYIEQILKPDGTCEDCPDYSHPDWTAENNYTCVTDECTSFSQYLAKNGTCQYCPDFSRPDDTFKECIKDDCNLAREIQNIDGTCSSCAEFTYPNAGNTRCIVDRCDASTQILQTDGTCFTCPDYTRPDRDNRACIDDGCTPLSQIVLIRGDCQSCDTFKRADDAQRNCFSETCNNTTQVLLTTGFCQTCNYSRPDSENLSCIKDDCDDTSQILLPNGLCQTCAEYKHPDSSNRECVAEQCEENEKLKLDGYCQQCEAYTRPDATKRYCIQDTCSDTQKWTTDGYCSDCDEYFRANDEKTDCITDTCGPRQFKDIKGVCSECPQYKYPSEDDKSCVFDTCTQLQKLLTDGTCGDCDPYTRADDTGKDCKQDVCSYQTQIIQLDGTCSSCQKYFRPDATNKNCIQDTCSDTQKLTTLGYCQNCDQYFRANDDKTDCITDTCGLRDYKDIKGVCSECPLYKYPSEDDKSCVFDTCTQLQKQLVDGTCGDCDPYTRADDTGKDCTQENCSTESQILQIDGTCKTCAEYYGPDATNRNCIQDTCTDTQKLTTNGRCQDCDQYFRANYDNTVCITDTCGSREIKDIKGVCSECPDYKYPTDDDTSCIADPCNQESQITTILGKCQDCLQYSRPDESNRQCIQDSCTSDQAIQIDGTCKAINVETSGETNDEGSGETSDDEKSEAEDAAGGGRRLQDEQKNQPKNEGPTCAAGKDKCLTQKQIIQEISFWHFVAIASSFLCLYHIIQILLFAFERKLQQTNKSPSDFCLSLENLQMPDDLLATPTNVSDIVRDYLSITYDIEDQDIFYILPCYDIEEYWSVEKEALNLKQNLKNEQLRVNKVNSMLLQKRIEMKKATFNYQVDEAENEDSNERIEGIIEGKTPLQEEPYITERGQEFAETGGFVPVKSKNGRIHKNYDIHDPDSNSLENIAQIEDPYDEQKSGGEEESEDGSRSVRSAKSIKSSTSKQSKRRPSSKQFQQEDWMEDKFTGDVFVVFNDIRSKHKIIFNQNTLISTLRFMCERFKSAISSKALYPSLHDFQECDEPEGVLWKNFNIKHKSGVIKKFFTIYVWSLLLMIGQAVAMFVVKQRIEGLDERMKRGEQFHLIQLPFAIAKTLIIIIFNKVQDFVLDRMVTNFGEHTTLEKRYSRLTMDLVIVKILTTCIITLVVFSADNGESYNPIAYLVINDDFVLTILFTTFFQGFVLPLIQVIYPGRILKDNQKKSLLKRSKKGVKITVSQEQLDKMVKGEDIGLHFRISDFVCLIVTNILVAPLVPSVLPLTFLGCIAHYWANKYVIIRKCESEQFSTRKITFKILRKTIWLITLKGLSYIYIWTKINGEFFDFYNIDQLLGTSFFRSSMFPAYLGALILFLAFISPFVNNRLFQCINAVYSISTSAKKYSNNKNRFCDIFSVEFVHDYMRDYPLTQDQAKRRQSIHMLELEASRSQMGETAAEMGSPHVRTKVKRGKTISQMSSNHLEQSDERALVSLEEQIQANIVRRHTEVNHRRKSLR